jgi:hypothetical protein
VTARFDTAEAPAVTGAAPPPEPAAPPSRRRGPALAFGAVMLVLLAAVLVLFSQDGRRLAGGNNVFERFTNIGLQAGQTACDRREVVPAGTGWVRLSVDRSGAGAALAMTVRDGAGRTLGRGTLAAGWAGAHVDVPVDRIARTVPDAQVCVTPRGPLALRGYGAIDDREGVAIDGQPTRETIRLSYLRAGEETWWSVIPAIVHRMGIARGRVFDGAWMFGAWLAALLAAGALAARSVVPRRGRPARRRVPGAAWLCAGCALLSGTAWAFLTPPFHVPDEVSHVAYAQYLAETGKLPRENGDLAYSPDEQQTLGVTEFYEVVGDAEARPPWTEAQDRRMDALAPLSPVGSGNAQSATSQPALYYAAQTLPYRLGGALGLGLLDRLMLMRFLSVLCAAATTLAAFLFLRETLPSRSWAWTAGGLAVALQPLFGFVSAGVQGDAALFTVSAVLLLALARAFRRGLTLRTGAVIGAAVGLGLMTKLTFAGLVPGAALGVLLLARRDRAWRALGAAAGLAVAIAAAHAVVNRLVWDRPLFGAAPPTGAAAAGAPAPSPNALELVSYVWQLYLPRLPFMTDQFPAGNPMPNLWLHGLLGRFGWLDTTWPDAVYAAGRWAFVAIAVLAAVEFVRAARRGALRGRWAELLCYATIAAGLLALIGVAGYNARLNGEPGFEQARYLLPLLPLYGAAVALAARVWGSWRGPVAAAVLIALAFGHDLLAQLLTVSRFYG